MSLPAWFPAALALAAARLIEAEPRAFARAAALAAFPSFPSASGYQSDAAVYGIDGGRFGDRLRNGLPLTLTTVADSVLLVES